MYLGDDLALEDLLAGLFDLLEHSVVGSGALDDNALLVEVDIVRGDTIELAEDAGDSATAAAAAHLDVKVVLVLCGGRGRGRGRSRAER